MLVVYILTLLVPLITSFYLDEMEEENFFSFLSFNKALIFLNGYILGLLTGINPALCVLSGLAHFGFYILVMKLVKGLEYSGKKAEVNIGDTGTTYQTIDDSACGKVLIAGEFYRAVPYSRYIVPFTPIKVVDKVPNSDILIVDIRL